MSCEEGVNEKKLTSPTLLIFSSLSAGEKPKSLLSPNRTLSPSNLNALLPNSNNSNSKAQANVDFPEAVIQENECLAFILVE